MKNQTKAITSPKSPRPKPPVPAEHEVLLRAGKAMVDALGAMFAPLCEVVLHDLTKPHNSIIAISNPLSGRKIGDATTELGLSRISDPSFPDIVQNYPNRFEDGRLAKSTSIGLRDSSGKCVAALCLNMDLSLLGATTRVIEQLASTGSPPPIAENLRAPSLDSVSQHLEKFAAELGMLPRALTQDQRRDAVRQLSASGFLQLRGAPAAAAATLGITRATIYNLLKERS